MDESVLPIIANQTCACGKAFFCGAEAGDCWCMRLPRVMQLPSGTAAEAICMCPDCLRKRVRETEGAR